MIFHAQATLYAAFLITFWKIYLNKNLPESSNEVFLLVVFYDTQGLRCVYSILLSNPQANVFQILHNACTLFMYIFLERPSASYEKKKTLKASSRVIRTSRIHKFTFQKSSPVYYLTLRENYQMTHLQQLLNKIASDFKLKQMPKTVFFVLFCR